MVLVTGGSRSLGLALAAAAAVALGAPTPQMARPFAAPMMIPIPDAPVRNTVKHLTRKQRQDRAARRRRARAEQERQAATRTRNGRYEMSPFQRLVHRMHNSERQAWAHAKYPGLSKGDVAQIEPYIRRLRREDAVKSGAAVAFAGSL